MRITQVIVTDAFAGTERYVVEVSGELSRRGHDVAVIGGQPANMRRLLPDDVSWTPAPAAKPAVRALVGGGRRDLVHSHDAKSDFVVAMAAPATRGVRVSTRHLTVRRGYSSTAVRLAPLVRRAMRCELAVSAFVAGAVESRVDEVIVNGVRPVADVTTPRQPVVLVAQRFAPEKATGLALDAWAASGLGDRGWRLQMAGDGPQRGELETRAAQLPGVELLGWVDDLEPLLACASILLAPAPSEPCGLTVLEAMAHGLPVVATDSGGHVETVAREPTAALFAAGDASGAAGHLVRLASDEPARAAYGEALRTLQRRELTLSRHVDRLEAAYARARCS
jgi:glycosyltransferase involved in cell wall biosynthesis